MNLFCDVPAEHGPHWLRAGGVVEYCDGLRDDRLPSERPTEDEVVESWAQADRDRGAA